MPSPDGELSEDAEIISESHQTALDTQKLQHRETGNRTDGMPALICTLFRYPYGFCL